MFPCRAWLNLERNVLVGPMRVFGPRRLLVGDDVHEVLLP